jgi:4-amino-4-deoxy-L-arabinose transferase-like glycosyltransferase
MYRWPAVISKRQEISLVLVLTAVAWALCLFRIGRRSLWFDEAYSVQTVQHWDAIGQFGIEPNMWLYYATLWIWANLGWSEGMLRGLSALYAAACVPVIYGLGSALFDRRVGVIAAVLLAVNAYAVWYGQDLRAYSMMILACGLSTLGFVQVMRRRGRHTWIGYGLATGLAIYVHYLSVLTTAAQIASLLFWNWRRIPWRQLCGAAVLALVTALPMLVSLRPGAGNLDWIKLPQIVDLVITMKELTGGGTILLIYIGLMLNGLIRHWYPGGDPRATPGSPSRSWSVALLGIWCLGPPILIFIGSLLLHPMYVHRYFSPSLLPLLLLTAVGLAAAPRRGRVLIWLVVITLSVRSLAYWYRKPEDFNYRDAVSTLLQRSQAGDALGTYRYYIAIPVHYYLERLANGRPVPVFVNLASGPFHEGGGSPQPQPDTRLLERLPERYQRFWLLISKDDPSWTERIQDGLSRNYSVIDRWEFGEVRLLLYLRQP